MFIGHIWTEHNLDTESSLKNLEREFLIATESEGPYNQNVYIISAAEVKVLLDQQISKFITHLKQAYKTNVKLVSAACTSFHAALLDLNQSDRNSAFIFFLELNQGFQQGCLNSLGIGDEKEQDGLRVNPGLGLVHVIKDSEADGLCIASCEILSQQVGISGTTKLISNITDRLNGLPANAKCVSFDICSDWGKRLLQGVEAAKCLQPVDSWLPSIEKNQRHFLSLKPVLEIDKYQSVIDSGPIFIMTLGGGGRVGCLLIDKTANKKNRLHINKLTDLPATKTNFDLHRDFEVFRNALQAESKQDYYHQVSRALKYPQKQFRGIENHYFEWNLDGAVF